MALADHCVVMNDGRIEDEGPPERVYARPATRFSADLHGRKHAAFGQGVRMRRHATMVETRLGRSGRSQSSAGEPGFEVTLAIRPEHITLEPQARIGLARRGQGGRRRLPGQLQARARRFAATDPSIRFIAKASRRPRRLRPGDTVEVSCRGRRHDPSDAVSRWRRLQVIDARRWYETIRMADGVTLIHEPWIKPFFRCNIWHVRGRDRDLLFDSGLGHVSLRATCALVSERKLVCVASHTHFDHIGCHHEFPDRCVHRRRSAHPRRPAQRLDARRPLRDRRDVRSAAGGLGCRALPDRAGAGRPHPRAGRRRRSRRPRLRGDPHARPLAGRHRALRDEDRHPAVGRHRL